LRWRIQSTMRLGPCASAKCWCTSPCSWSTPFCLNQTAPSRQPTTWCAASNGNDSWRERMASWNIWWLRSPFDCGPNYHRPPHYPGLRGCKKGIARSHLLWHPWRQPPGRTHGVDFMAHKRTKMLDPIEETLLPVIACV
jgi:hypothetical protein